MVKKEKAWLKQQQELENNYTPPTIEDRLRTKAIVKYVSEKFENHGIIKIAEQKVQVDGEFIDIGISSDELDALVSKERVAIKKEAIGKHIYRYYSEKKQGQDRGYQAYSQTAIVGITAQTDNPITLDSLTVEVMGAVLQIFAEVLTLSDFVESKPENLQEHYEKLVKIGMRLKWTKLCIDEGKLAIAENREPNYPNYPKFD